MPRNDNREALEGFFLELNNMFPLQAKAVVNLFIRELGGLRVSVPDHDEIYRLQRDAKIRETFNGANHKELALRWNISTATVRRIVDRRR